MSQRSWIEHEIARLDPEADSERIVLLSTNRVLPRFGRAMAMNLVYTLGFLRISAQIEGARVVDAIGKIHRAPEARAEASMGAFALWISQGPRSEAGRASLSEVRRIHDQIAQRHPIYEEEMVNSICLFTVQFQLLFDTLGLPGYSEAEKRAQVAHWLEIGQQLGIEQMPQTWQGMVDSMHAYEADPQRFGPSAAGARCAQSLVSQFAARQMPPGLRWAAEPMLASLLDEPVLAAIDMRPPPKPVVTSLRATLRATVALGSRLFREPRELIDPTTILATAA